MVQYLFNYFIKLITPTSSSNCFFLLNQHIFYKIFDVYLIHLLSHSNLSLKFLHSPHLSRNLSDSYCLAFFVCGFLKTNSYFTNQSAYFQFFYLNFLWKIKMGFSFLQNHLIKQLFFVGFHLI